MRLTLSKPDYLNRLETVQIALREKEITTQKATSLIDRLSFMYRLSDPIEWGRYYLKDKFTLPTCNELHQYFVAIAEEPFTNTLAPRGHAKTTIKCVVIPLFLALNFPEKYRHYLNIQSTSTKAIAVNLAIRRELETNELILRDYGDLVSQEKWTERQFVLKNGVIFTAIGAGESVRGINHNNIRPDYTLADDLYDDDCISSPNQVRKINDWYWSSIYKCVANDRPTCQHIQGTAISRLDLMHLLINKAGWVSKKFQAVKNYDSKEVLWPEANSFEKLMQDKEAMGSIIFEREMQNNLRDDNSAIIKLGWVKFYDGRQLRTREEASQEARLNGVDLESIEYKIETIGGIDPAEKTGELNDFTAKVAVIKTNFNNYYVVSVKNDKLSQHQNIQDIKSWNSECGFDLVKFETNKAYGLFEEARRTTDVPLREVITTKDKLTRLISVSPKFENGKVFISNLIPEQLRNELVEQLINNLPTHDDLRDALVLCLENETRELIIV